MPPCTHLRSTHSFQRSNAGAPSGIMSVMESFITALSRRTVKEEFLSIFIPDLIGIVHALHHAAELLLLPCPTLSSDRSRMEKKNRVTANPFVNEQSLDQKSYCVLQLRSQSMVDGDLRPPRGPDGQIARRSTGGTPRSAPRPSPMGTLAHPSPAHPRQKGEGGGPSGEAGRPLRGRPSIFRRSVCRGWAIAH